ncbi:MAG: hypothetical protein P1V35_17070 [Planctomycetota bacterium]|nr:hypothetical protein [Planctomycetota bacterium]
MSILRLVSRLGIAVTGILFGTAIQSCGGEVVHVPAIEQAGAERIRGTRVSLVRPKGWDVAPSFAGFMEMETQSTLMVMEIEGPYGEVAKGFNDKRVLAAQKMQIVDRVPFSHGTYPGLLFQMTQENGPVPVRKWVWLFGSELRSVMVMGVCAEELPENVFDALGTAVRSASWDPDLILDPKAELDYFLGDDGGMKPISLMSASLTYNLDGEIDEDGLEGGFPRCASPQSDPLHPGKVRPPPAPFDGRAQEGQSRRAHPHTGGWTLWL